MEIAFAKNYSIIESIERETAPSEYRRFVVFNITAVFLQTLSW